MFYPNQCYIEITDRCNLKCKHCFANAQQKNKNFLSYSEIVNIYKQLENVGVIYVNISGGEPLLHPEIFDIISYASKQPYNTCLLTNGILWNEEKIAKLKESDPDNNIYIQLSLDGQYEIMNEHRNMTKTEYEKMIENIKLFKKYGFYVTGLHTADSITIKESLNTCKYYIENYNIDSIQIVPAFMAGRATENHDLLDNYWNEWIQLVLQVTDIKKYGYWGQLSERLSLGFFTLYEIVVPLDKNNRHSDIWDVWGLDVDNVDNYRKQLHRNYYCEAGCSELAISSTKEMYPCVAALRTSMRCGTLKEKSINEIWTDSEMLDKFRNLNDTVIKKEPCSSCNYKIYCNGGCRVASLELTGDFYNPDPRCPIVKEYKNNKEMEML